MAQGAERWREGAEGGSKEGGKVEEKKPKRGRSEEDEGPEVASLHFFCEVLARIARISR